MFVRPTVIKSSWHFHMFDWNLVLRPLSKMFFYDNLTIMRAHLLNTLQSSLALPQCPIYAIQYQAGCCLSVMKATPTVQT